MGAVHQDVGPWVGGLEPTVDMATDRHGTRHTGSSLFLLPSSLRTGPVDGRRKCNLHIWDKDLRAKRQMTGTHCNKSKPGATVLISRTGQRAASDTVTFLLECSLLSCGESKFKFLFPCTYFLLNLCLMRFYTCLVMWASLLRVLAMVGLLSRASWDPR